MACKSFSIVSFSLSKKGSTDPNRRIDDEAALRAKVDEALNVYDEYMKNKGGEEPSGDVAKPKEGAKEGEEETKS